MHIRNQGSRSKFAKGPWQQLKTYEDISGINMTKNQSLTQFLWTPKISPNIVMPRDCLDDRGYNKVNGMSDNNTQLFLKMDKSHIGTAYGPEKTGDPKCMLYMMPSVGAV